jgi:hypothetical protein
LKFGIRHSIFNLELQAAGAQRTTHNALHYCSQGTLTLETWRVVVAFYFIIHSSFIIQTSAREAKENRKRFRGKREAFGCEVTLSTRVPGTDLERIIYRREKLGKT